MDEKLSVEGDADFGEIEEIADLDAPELGDILADAPRPSKGKEKAVEIDEEEDVEIDEDGDWNWGAMVH